MPLTSGPVQHSRPRTQLNGQFCKPWKAIKRAAIAEHVGALSLVQLLNPEVSSSTPQEQQHHYASLITAENVKQLGWIATEFSLPVPASAVGMS